MHRTFCLLAFLLTATATFSQKYDYNWLVGYDSAIPQDLHYGVSNIHFHSGHAEVDFVGESPMYFDSYGVTMSDKNGQLLFYSNGCELLNAHHLPIENGDSLNPGSAFHEWCENSYFEAYRVPQGAFSLPAPDNDSIYYLFHLGVMDFALSPSSRINKLYYTKINMAANNGLGKVIDKNHLLIEDTLFYGQLTGVRHGNGRDWWIIMPESGSDRYYTFLLGPQGVSGPFIQSVGKKWTAKDRGQAHFTPDGTKYLRFGIYNKLNIYDFDRCSGQLSNHRYIDVGYKPDTIGANGLAISPDSRYAYASTDERVWQYDLQAADIQASGVQIAYIDWVLAPPGQYTFFYSAQLAPDGKIYLNCAAAVAYMHVIHQPNEAGTACNLEQRGLPLAGYNAFTLPHFPNYRLYDIPGSLCDTLGIDTPVEIKEPAEIPAISIHPNPAADFTEFTFPQEGTYQIQIYDLSGRVLRRDQVTGDAFTLHTGAFVDGLYFYRVNMANKPAFCGKFVVQH